MGGTARLGVVCLMLLAVGLARLVEVELDPGTPPALSMPTPTPTADAPVEDSPGAATAPTPTAAAGSSDASSPAAPKRAPDDAPWPSGRVYVVKKGESLGSISKKVYGTTKHWKDIQAANRTVIPDPTRMRPGIELRLPRIGDR